MRVLTAASTLKDRWFSHLDDRFPSGSYDLNSRAQTVCEPLEKVAFAHFSAIEPNARTESTGT